MRQKQIAVITAVSLSLVVFVLLAGFGWATPALPGPSGYHILKTIHLPGTEGWDYLTTDSAARILYISRISRPCKKSEQSKPAKPRTPLPTNRSLSASPS